LIGLSHSLLRIDGSWYIRGTILGSLGRFEDAILSFNRSLDINPGNAPVLHARAVLLHQLGRFDKAVESSEEALSIDPGLYSAWQAHAHALLRLGRNEEALVSLDRALEGVPDRHRLWYAKGKALVRLIGLRRLSVHLKKPMNYNLNERIWKRSGGAGRKPPEFSF
jgi:FOG: TPR repeat